MYVYPPVEHNGLKATVSARKEPTGRWKATVQCGDRQSAVPTSFPTEEKAIEAAYAHARMLLSQQTEKA